jgi:hypothetical protein
MSFRNIFLIILIELRYFQLLSECGYAQLKRLPTETQILLNMQGLSSDPFLKHIESTAGRVKYELLEQDAGQFGSMKVFITSGYPVTVRIIDDDGLKNAGI